MIAYGSKVCKLFCYYLELKMRNSTLQEDVYDGKENKTEKMSPGFSGVGICIKQWERKVSKSSVERS